MYEENEDVCCRSNENVRSMRTLVPQQILDEAAQGWNKLKGVRPKDDEACQVLKVIKCPILRVYPPTGPFTR